MHKVMILWCNATKREREGEKMEGRKKEIDDYITGLQHEILFTNSQAIVHELLTWNLKSYKEEM